MGFANSFPALKVSSYSSSLFHSVPLSFCIPSYQVCQGLSSDLFHCVLTCQAIWSISLPPFFNHAHTISIMLLLSFPRIRADSHYASRFRSVTVQSPFHLRSVTMVAVHIVRRVQSPSRTAHDRRPAIISIKYAARCHGMHFPLFVNYWNFCDNKMIVTSKCAIKKSLKLT